MWDHPHPSVRDAYKRIQALAMRTGGDLLTCDRCGHDMVVRATQVTENPCKNDVRLKCPTTDDMVLPADSDPGDLGVDLAGCGWWTQHGLPMSREDYEEELARREELAEQTGWQPARLVDAVQTPAPELDRSVKERLNALGYLDP